MPFRAEFMNAAGVAAIRPQLMKRLSGTHETVSKLGVLCGTTFLAARRLGESNVVLFECSVHNGRPHLEHEVCSSR